MSTSFSIHLYSIKNNYPTTLAYKKYFVQTKTSCVHSYEYLLSTFQDTIWEKNQTYLPLLILVINYFWILSCEFWPKLTFSPCSTIKTTHPVRLLGPVWLFDPVSEYSHLSNKRGAHSYRFWKIPPSTKKNPSSTFIDSLDFSTLHSSFIRVMH